jgi:LPXTG-motif cell wall-anchored protein
MKHKTTAVRLLGGLLMAVALLPWVSGTAAQAAVTVHLDKKWIGFNSATGEVQHADCAYTEIQQTHSGTGWHFVLTGGSGLTSFTAYFQTAGAVTVTTTETASGVIVQDGKGAVIFTPTNDTLVAGPSTYPGDGTAASGDVLQLSHICTGIPTTPPSSPPVTTSAPATTTAPAVAPTTAKASPSASVAGVKNAKPPAVLPKTGSGMSLGTALAISLGLLLGGAALMSLPRRVAVQRNRRH